MKKIFLFLPLICVLVLGVFAFKGKVYLDEHQLPVTHLDATDQKDADWIFEVTVDGEKKEFIVYQWIIDALTSPEIVSLNLSDCDEQCYEEERMSSHYLGQTEEGSHLLVALDKKHWRHVLLFLEVLKGEGVTLNRNFQEEQIVFYHDQVLLKKLGYIPLPGYIMERDIAFDGKNLTILNETYSLDLTPPSQPELIRGRLPLHFDRRPYINPRFIEGFSSSVRTGGSVMITCDLEQAQRAPAYDFLGNGLTDKYGWTGAYGYVGKTKDGVHIVRSCYFDCRPVQCLHFMFVFEKDYEIIADWESKTFKRNKKRILIKKMGELDLYCLKYFNIDENVISYTDSFWDNKPYVMLGPVEEVEYQDEIKLKTTN